MAKILVGTVVSTKMEKTVVVEIERAFRHKLYKKIIKRSKRYQAHNLTDGLAVGDRVRIEQVRPISKHKHFQVVAKVE